MSDIPALFMETLIGDEVNDTFTTVAQELVQGVENIQILYGLDNTGNDGIADIYMKANDGAMDWDNVVTVRLSMRMRSINSVYNEDLTFAKFEGINGTDGADRFMRQDLSTTVRIRNR